MKAAAIMVSPVITVKTDDTLEEVARTMVQNRIGCVPVLNQLGEMVGIITQSDFVAREHGVPFSTFRHSQVLGEWLSPDVADHIYQASRTRKAREIMNSPVACVSVDETLANVLNALLTNDVNHVVVLQDRRPVGIISRFDLLRLMLDRETGASRQPRSSDLHLS